MVGYNTDQFYKLPSGVATTAELSPDSYSNPTFLYPGSTRKHSENGHWTDKGGLQRGFMRMLPMSKGDSASEEMRKRRFFFQFNPSNIVRDLSMRDDVRNPLLLSPSEFSVPTPGMTSFGFELFLDRTAELNNKSDLRAATDELNMDAGGRRQNTSQAAPDNDPLLNGSPSEVGVLADIRVLDTIIGAGITADMMDYIIERGKINSSYATSDSSTTTTYPPTGTDASATTTTTTSLPGDDTAISWDSESVRQAFDWNVGNQAFLFPNPVRVVFSSLFMVEGYVTGVTVSYPKFNEAMVPMQCSVAIQMQALYMGFAKNDTYFTWALDNAEAQVISGVDSLDVVVDTAEFEALKELAFGTNSALANFRVVPTYQLNDIDNYDSTSRGNEIKTPPSAPEWDSDNYLDGVTSEAEGGRYYKYGMPQMLALSDIRMHYGWVQPIPEEKENDPIYSKFIEGSGYSLNYSWTMRISRGPLTDWETNSGTTDFVLAEYSVNESCSTADEWDAIRRKKKIAVPNTYMTPGNERWARGLYIRTSGGSASLDEAVWKANAKDWLSSDSIFKVVVEVNGSISDGNGNTVGFSGSETSYFGAYNPLLQMYVTLRSEISTKTPTSGATGGALPVVDRE